MYLSLEERCRAVSCCMGWRNVYDFTYTQQRIGDTNQGDLEELAYHTINTESITSYLLNESSYKTGKFILTNPLHWRYILYDKDIVVMLEYGLIDSIKSINNLVCYSDLNLFLPHNDFKILLCMFGGISRECFATEALEHYLPCFNYDLCCVFMMFGARPSVKMVTCARINNRLDIYQLFRDNVDFPCELTDEDVNIDAVDNPWS